MSAVELNLSEDVVARLAARARREGIEPEALAERVLGEYLDVDPLGFVGSVSSATIVGADADQLLEAFNFGH